MSKINTANQSAKAQLRRLEERRDWRERQWSRRSRSSRWLIQDTLAAASAAETRFVKPPRIARCGWPIGGLPSIRLTGHTASFSGIEHCASPWACPICSTIIRSARARDLQTAADKWTDRGHGLVFITLTRPHAKSESLDTGMSVVTGSWTTLSASQQWRSIKTSFAIIHWARSLEITWNPRHGWHVHLHLLVFTDPQRTDCKRLQHMLLDLWNDILTRKGSRVAGKRHGIMVLPVATTPGSVGRYLSKTPDHVGSEIVRMDTKTGRDKSISPFQFLDQHTVDQLGELQARYLWTEYVWATHGHRSITWSRRLRAELVGAEDKSDRQIINDTMEGDTILDMPAATYRNLRRQPNLLAFILSRVETGEAPLASALVRLAGRDTRSCNPTDVT